jgi:hypothetical protein
VNIHFLKIRKGREVLFGNKKGRAISEPAFVMRMKRMSYE